MNYEFVELSFAIYKKINKIEHTMNTYNRIFRIMHWAIAFCILFLLLTIFLRMYWLEKNHVAAILGANLQTLEINLTQDQLIKIAKQIRKPMWDWHVYIGYVLIGLYTIRLALPFFGEMKFKNPMKATSLKQKIQYWSYLLFYVFVGVSLITGFFIEQGPATWKKALESVHTLALYYLLPFIFIHFIGIFIAEKREEKGIVSRIIRS